MELKRAFSAALHGLGFDVESKEVHRVRSKVSKQDKDDERQQLEATEPTNLRVGLVERKDFHFFWRRLLLQMLKLVQLGQAKLQHRVIELVHFLGKRARLIQVKVQHVGQVSQVLAVLEVEGGMVQRNAVLLHDLGSLTLSHLAFGFDNIEQLTSRH